MRHPLPLNALRAFEATARLGSFTRAARELRVTPAAVGQQVRGLEARLGGPLFDRVSDGLTPTARATRALPMLRRGFDALAQAYDGLAEANNSRRLTISVAPSFALKWLVPRLHRFHERHPEIELSIDTAMRFVDVSRGEADLAVRFGDGSYYGLQCERLFGEWILPVCAPSLCTGPDRLREPRDLAGLPLIHIREETTDTEWADWPAWCVRFGLDQLNNAEGPSFSQSVAALEAALAGQGVALCGLSYALDDIEAGRLCAPFGGSSAIPARYGYDTAFTAVRAENPPIRAVRRWIQDEANETRRRMEAFLAA
jgi:LysR family glycine cleavage system transcriptional activator